MDELKKIIEALGKTFEEFKAANDKEISAIKAKGYAPADVVEKVEKINADLSAMSKMKDDLEALQTAFARGEFKGGGTTVIDKAKAEYKAAFETWFRKGGEGQQAALKQMAIQASLSTLSDPDGAYTVAPPEFDQAIDRVAGTVSVMRQLATVRTIGVPEYKKLINQGGAESGWVAEKQTRSETDTPTLSEIIINAKEIYANPGCTQIALDDSMMDLASWLADEVSISFAEKEGLSFIKGNGVEQPHGIDNYTKVANSSYSWGKIGYTIGGHATLLNNADKLDDLVTSLKSIYLNGASFLMNRTTASKIRQLKNGNGDYIWRPGLAAGEPNTLLGYPVKTDDNVDDIGGSKYPVFFGNFKRAYLIVDRVGIRILRNPYTSPGNVFFYTTKRVGAGIVMYEAIKALKIYTS